MFALFFRFDKKLVQPFLVIFAYFLDLWSELKIQIFQRKRCWNWWLPIMVNASSICISSARCSCVCLCKCLPIEKKMVHAMSIYMNTIVVLLENMKFPQLSWIISCTVVAIDSCTNSELHIVDKNGKSRLYISNCVHRTTFKCILLFSTFLGSRRLQCPYPEITSFGGLFCFHYFLYSRFCLHLLCLAIFFPYLDRRIPIPHSHFPSFCDSLFFPCLQYQLISCVNGSHHGIDPIANTQENIVETQRGKEQLETIPRINKWQ